MWPYGVVRAPSVVEGRDGFVSVEFGGLALIGREDGCPLDEPARFMEGVCAIAEREVCVPMRAQRGLMDVAACERVLRSGGERFFGLLEKLEGAWEWGVWVPGGAGVDGEVSGGGEGEGLSFLERRRVELAAGDGIEAGVARAAGRFERALSPVCREVKTLGGRGGGACVALLVEEGREGEVASRFEGCAEALGVGAALTGPWPGFAFVGA